MSFATRAPCHTLISHNRRPQGRKGTRVDTIITVQAEGRLVDRAALRHLRGYGQTLAFLPSEKGVTRLGVDDVQPIGLFLFACDVDDMGFQTTIDLGDGKVFDLSDTDGRSRFIDIVQSRPPAEEPQAPRVPLITVGDVLRHKVTRGGAR